jgi:serine/threonine protein phosphatase PrpC
MVTEISFGAATHPGRVRALNEDAVLATPPVFAVADGMGGHAAGEVAAALALSELGSLCEVVDLAPSDVEAAVGKANSAIARRSAEQAETAGMGTTLAGLCLGNLGGVPHWLIFNVGDSRVYRFVDDGIVLMTVDHSEVEELIQAGEITPDEARSHPRRNVVTRSLGTTPAPVADLWVQPAAEGDVFLLCSDGLTGELTDDVIAAVLAATANNRATSQAIADELVALAIAHGGRDNVSAIVVALESVPLTAAVEVSTIPRNHLMER